MKKRIITLIIGLASLFSAVGFAIAVQGELPSIYQYSPDMMPLMLRGFRDHYLVLGLVAISLPILSLLSLKAPIFPRVLYGICVTLSILYLILLLLGGINSLRLMRDGPKILDSEGREVHIHAGKARIQ